MFTCRKLVKGFDAKRSCTHLGTNMKKETNSTIKAHLISGAFYLLLLVAVCAIPFALAQRNASKRSVAKPNLSAIAKLRQTAPPLTRVISAPAATDISKTGQLQLPHYILTGASADERVVNAAIPGGVCQFHVLIVYADTGGLPTQLQSEIQAEPNVVAVDLFDATVGIPTLGQLQQYEIVVPFSNSPFLDGDMLGCSLTFWICAACSFTVALSVAISFFNSCTVLCFLRNSLSNIAFTWS